MAEKKQQVKLVTPMGRLSFHSFFAKRKFSETSKGEPKYDGTIILDIKAIKGDKVELARFNAIKTEMDRVCRDTFKKSLADAKKLIPRFWDPIRDGKEKEHLDGYGAGTLFFKANTEHPVGIVGPDKITPITEDNKDAIYSGCYVRFNVTPFAYDNDGKGVGIALNSVMMIRDGERLDGGRSNPTEDFGEVEVEGVEMVDALGGEEEESLLL